MQKLKKLGIEYNFIDTGQHGALTGKILDQFNLEPPDVCLRKLKNNISTIFQAIAWILMLLWQIIFRKMHVYRRAFKEQEGICLIHGDTLTTLISLIYAKRCGLKVAHIEAGLRSFNILNPFPEEIIRIIAMRWSELLFTPSDWAYQNIVKMGLDAKAINIQGNTIIDAVEYARSQENSYKIPKQPYVLVTIHRVETIFSKSRMKKLLSIILMVAAKYQVYFVLHDPTRKQLDKYGMIDTIDKHSKITTLTLLPYIHFINLLDQSEFVMTDGGSIQEETAYLDIPCIILRSKTERLDGLKHKSLLSSFNIEDIKKFMDQFPNLSRVQNQHKPNPSKDIVEYLVKEYI